MCWSCNPCLSREANTPFRPELAWIGTESNEFGTDEFMKWCEVVGTEPYLCLNFGTGKSSLSLINCLDAGHLGPSVYLEPTCYTVTKPALMTFLTPTLTFTY